MRPLDSRTYSMKKIGFTLVYLTLPIKQLCHFLVSVFGLNVIELKFLSLPKKMMKKTFPPSMLEKLFPLFQEPGRRKEIKREGEVM
jgi:hypothetical protein